MLQGKVVRVTTESTPYFSMADMLPLRRCILWYARSADGLCYVWVTVTCG